MMKKKRALLENVQVGVQVCLLLHRHFVLGFHPCLFPTRYRCQYPPPPHVPPDVPPSDEEESTFLVVNTSDAPGMKADLELARQSQAIQM